MKLLFLTAIAASMVTVSAEPAIRTIDRRNAPVAGIDLEHSLNYIMVSDVSPEFIYDRYTSSRILYKKGTRPRLESIVEEVTKDAPDKLQGVKLLCKWVTDHIPHARIYMQKTGKILPPDRAMTEEQLIDSGYGWCNEQARVFCALTQIYGIPSRLVFLFMPPGQPPGGHVISEVLLPDGWLAVDQSLNFFFINKQKKYVRAVDVYNLPENRNYFSPLYAQARADRRKSTERHIMEKVSKLSLVADPLMAFTDVGFHNYYIRSHTENCRKGVQYGE